MITLTGWAHLYTPCPDRAQDWAMETLHACARCFGRYPWECAPEDIPRLMGWCKRKLHDLACDTRRRETREHTALQHWHARQQAETLTEQEYWDYCAAREVYARLDPFCQQLVYWLLTGETWAEIGARLQMPVSTLSSRLERALDKACAKLGYLRQKSSRGCVKIVVSDGINYGSAREAPSKTCEVVDDGTHEAVVAVERDGAVGGECRGVAEHPLRDSRVARGGGDECLSSDDE